MKNFTHPLTPEALAAFCSPATDSCFADPWGVDGATYAANGYCVLCYERDFAYTGNHEAQSRIEALPWAFHHSATLRATAWGELDRVRGGLWRDGLLEPFGTSPDGKRFAKIARRVLVGESYVCVPVPILQLISRLPRAEVYTGPLGAEWLLFRFNGGIGLAKGLKRTAGYHIFQPKPGLFSR